MQGFTSKLQTSSDLFEKLKHDFKVFSNNPSDVYAAFNFFVTAEQMPDWIDNKGIRKEHEILRVLSHVANCAKHFTVDRHDAVQYATSWADDSCSKIYIKATEKISYGHNEDIDALSLARDILEFWENWMQSNG